MQLERLMTKRLPAAVQRQLEETEAFDKEVEAGTPTPPEPPKEPDEPPPAPPAEPAPAPAPTEDNWEHKFRTLQGKYNADVPRLQAQVNELTRERDELLKQKSTTPEPLQAEPAPRPKLVTDADAETFGADLIDLIRRVAREEEGPAKDNLMAELQAMKAKLPSIESDVKAATTVTAQTARDTYFTNLGKAVPDWTEINVNEDFKSWLLETDPLSGEVRQELLQRAFDAFDHGRTAAIFNAFKQLNAAPVAPQPEPEPPAPKADLEAELSPGRGRAPVPVAADDDKKVWTASEIQTFYTDVTRGAYLGQDADVKRIEAAIDKALAEGRVRG